MRWYHIVLLVLLVPLVTFLAGILFWRWYVVGLEERAIEVMVPEDNLIGFNAGTDKLYFGSVPKGGFGERKGHVVSGVPSIVIIKVEGELAGWVAVSKNRIRLEPGVAQEVVFRLTVPTDAVARNYSGTAVVQYHRPMFWE